MAHESSSTCNVCKGSFRPRDLIPTTSIRPQLNDFIMRKHNLPWSEETSICKKCLNSLRVEYVVNRLEQERGEISVIEREVARKAASHMTIVEELNQQFESTATFGQKVADNVARIAGSWTFIICFIICLNIWFFINTSIMKEQAFDPYPYILLNLILSCIAALQAPLIMMSQNRLAERDRLRAEHDFQVNLKAEIEVASLHEKIDHLLNAQWQRMVELQEIQIDLLTEHTKK